MPHRPPGRMDRAGIISLRIMSVSAVAYVAFFLFIRALSVATFDDDLGLREPRSWFSVNIRANLTPRLSDSLL